MQFRWSRLGRAVQFVRPHRTKVLGILALTLLVAELESVEPLILKYVFDQLGGTGGLRRDILLGVLALSVLTLTREMTTSVTTRMAWRTRLSVQHSLLDATAGRLQHKAGSLQRPEEAGALVARLDGGVQEFVDAMGEILENVLPSLAYLGMSVYVMLRLEWRMALLVMAFSPLPAIVGALAAPRQARRERRLLDHWAKLFAGVRPARRAAGAQRVLCPSGGQAGARAAGSGGGVGSCRPTTGASPTTLSNSCSKRSLRSGLRSRRNTPLRSMRSQRLGKKICTAHRC